MRERSNDALRKTTPPHRTAHTHRTCACGLSNPRAGAHSLATACATADAPTLPSRATHSPSLQRAPSNPPALGPGFDAWGHSRETRELAGAVGEGATPCTDGRPSETTPAWIASHQSSLPNAAKGYPAREPRASRICCLLRSPAPALRCPPPHAPAMEPPPEAADVDFSEVFAGDKIAFNNSKLNYWRTPRR